MIPDELTMLNAVIRAGYGHLPQADIDLICRIDGERHLWLCDEDRMALRRIHATVTAALRKSDGRYAKK